MLQKLIFTLLISLSVSSLYAQRVSPSRSVDIYKKLQTFNTLPRVLYMAAHPDDENTGLLSYLTQHEHIRTGYLSLTRGDGGQNLLGSELGAALGLIRTYELLEARKLDGAEQFFTRAIDFGFSKNPEDTFKQWNIDSVTADAVWVIRKFRPDIIICRFPPTSAAGHGQHSASAIIAERAFKAAGDPSQFPEQLAYVKPYQPRTLLWNTFRFGGKNTTSEEQFHIQAGQYDPLLGLGYGELAGISRSLHKSQGAGTPSVAGINTEYFESVAGNQPVESLWDGLDLTWAETDRKAFAQEVSQIIHDYDFKAPEKSIPALLKLRRSLSSWEPSTLKSDKLKALDAIILDCSGLLAELFTESPEAIPGAILPFKLQIVARSETPVKVRSIHWFTGEQTPNLALNRDELTEIKKEIKIPENSPVSAPYWMRLPASNPGLYSVPSDTLIGRPDFSEVPAITLTLQIAEQTFIISLPLSYKYLDPVRGDVIEPLRIVPEVDLQLNQTLFFSGPGRSLRLPVQLKSHTPVEGTLQLLHAGQVLKSHSLSLNPDTAYAMSFTLEPEDLQALGEAQLEVRFQTRKKTYNKGQALIQYAHLPSLQYFKNTRIKIIPLDIQSVPQRVGYLPGAGDLIPKFLELAGIEVQSLTQEDLTHPQRLNQLDAIITGVRIANKDARFRSWMPALLAYVKQGGTLLMQYNTSNHLITETLGPYPFTLSRDRVTEEDARVTLLNPQASLLQYPFKISEADFKGWVQERGLYFASQWDKYYKTLFSMHDTGEQPQEGALLYTPYGKGMYIYTGISFFRQLPAGNPGAIKLFLNLLSARQDEK